ncbi:hypothetical protein ACMSSJ_11200 [Kerstersia gyiorum]|uniref:hypothetical protein n=1 Tax=Kerstersia gyiorum TaxID=206506 RepID=UPI0039EA8080
MSEAEKLVITINNTRPVELIDLAQSMLSMASEYRQMLSGTSACDDPDEVKLYVKEVRAGSIVQELVPMAMASLPFIDQFNTVADFARHLSALRAWFLENRSLIGWQGQPLENKSLQNLSAILEPVAKDPGSVMHIGAVTVHGDVHVSVTIGSQEASAIQNNVNHALKEQKKSVSGEHRNVVMYWSQARNDKQAKSGDKAVIESISKAAVKVAFSSDDLKKRMLFDVAHPFEKAFIVDVWAETIHDKPVLYMVHEFRGVLDRDEDE